MILDHFGSPFSTYLYHCFGFFSAAEGFFFLSGFVGILAAQSKLKKGEPLYWMPCRALRIWKIHLMSVLFLVAAAFFIFPGLQPYFGIYFSRPVLAVFCSVFLIHIPPWLDVLPFYVFLLFAGFLVFPLLIRKHLLKTALFSSGLWLVSQWGLRDLLLILLPRGLYPGFFDLLAWQWIYFAGAITAAFVYGILAQSPCKEKILDRGGIVSILIFIFFFLWKYQWLPLGVPSEFWISREHLGILRLLNFLSFAGVISLILRKQPNLLDFSFTATLGKNSLIVYAFHTILVYAWFISPPGIRFSAPWNILIPITSVFLLWWISLLMEKSKRKF